MSSDTKPDKSLIITASTCAIAFGMLAGITSMRAVDAFQLGTGWALGVTILIFALGVAGASALILGRRVLGAAIVIIALGVPAVAALTPVKPPATPEYVPAPLEYKGR